MALLEDLIISRGRKAYSGQINPWDLSQWQPSVQGVRTMGARTLEDLSSTLRKSDVSGPAAATLMGRAQEGTQGNILNLATNLAGVPEGYVQQGLGTEQNKEQRELQRWQTSIAAREARKGRKLQEKTAKQQSQQGMSKGCSFHFTLTGKFTQPVREFRDRYFPENSFVSKGYACMASWMVPKMEVNRFAYNFIKYTMTVPLSRAAMCWKEKSGEGIFYIPIAVFWCLVWDYSERIRIIIR